MNKVQLKEIIKEFDLPEDTSFKGYVVKRRDTEELLAQMKSIGDSYLFGWTMDANLAKQFKIKKQAAKAAKEYGEPANAAVMLDVGTQYIVAEENPDFAK